MNKIITATKARANFFQLIDDVERFNQPAIVTVEGEPRIIMMSVEAFEGWQETLETVKDFPQLQKDIQEFQNDLTTGAYKKYTTLEKLLAKEGYVLADKPNVKYAISTKYRAKGGKRVGKSKRRNT